MSPAFPEHLLSAALVMEEQVMVREHAGLVM